MHAHRIGFLLSSVLALSACANEIRLKDPPDGSGVTCGRVDSAGTQWRAGCATRHNVAMLAEDPDDLILPRAETPGGMTPRGIFEGYGQSPRPGLRPAQTRTATAPASPDNSGDTE